MARARSGGGTGYAVALVIFGSGFVICLLLAIIFYSQYVAARDSASSVEQDFNEFATAQQRGSNVANELRNNNELDGDTVFGRMISQNQALNSRINQLQNNVSDLESEKTNLENNLQAAETARNDAQQRAVQAQEARNQLATTFDQRVDEIRSQINESTNVFTQAQNQFQTATSELSTTFENQQGQDQQQIQDLRNQLSQSEQTVQNLRNELEQLRDTFVGAGNPTENLTRPDANVVAQLSNNEVSLSVGSNQQVLPGMTFEIFGTDQLIQLDEYDQLRGKATVEVYQLQENSSTARIVRRQRGSSAVREGDQAVNLVYSPDADYRFLVNGRFNIDGQGDPTERDRERIQNMVRRWGGTLTDQLSYNVDFLVLGAQPPAPEPLPNDVIDPQRIQEYQAALEAYETYQNLVAEASQLGIPVLNQNRFLSLVGYYERS